MSSGGTKPLPVGVSDEPIQTLARERAQAIDEFRIDRNPDALTRRLTRAADRALAVIWKRAGIPSEWALLAVGGYGRRDLFPFSDVDLLILVDAPPSGEATRALETFIGQCWDAGLAIGQSVRTVQECVEEASRDITIQTALLERRLLFGATGVASALENALKTSIVPTEFMAGKTVEMRQRHARYQDTPFSLEPNTKESPGGLRDLQLIAWVARAGGFGENWAALGRNGLLTAAELQMIRHNERLIRRIRAALHVVANRHEDRLVFDMQAPVADLLGYRDRPDRRASEQLMQRYYRAAKTVTQLTTILLQNIDSQLQGATAPAATRVDDEFDARDGLLEVRDPQLFERDPSAILRAFLALMTTADMRGMSTPTLRALWNARTRIDTRFRREAGNRALFMRIITQPRGVTRTMRLMNQWSILGHYLPAFRRIVGRMQHDLFHVYTVDQHILMVLRNLRRFAIPEHAHEFPFCSQLMTTVERPWRLSLAALFHDIAKGRGGDHSVLGAQDARRFCRQHAIEAADADLICFLVEHHLTMSSVAQKQDLTDTEVIERFASIVGTPERLTALYLLTVADIRGTSPKVWNGWKAKLLEDLYRAARRALAGEQQQGSALVDARQQEAIRLLALRAVDPRRYQAFWKSLGAPYFLRTDSEDIAWHTRVFARGYKRETVQVKARIPQYMQGFQVAVYLPDQQDLFARLCGYFDSAGLSVLDARVYTTSAGYALDSFLVVDPYEAGSYRSRLSLVEDELTQRLAQRALLAEPSQGRPSRRSRSFPIKPQVEFRPYESGEHYLLSIVANDRPGLLYRIALVLAHHEIIVYSARVATLGERAEDTFIVDGPALGNPIQQLKIESDLREALALPARH
ncbi:MAG: [protein-PII] uridylyltransferase [Burkholderiaceae bacterium]